MALSGKWPPPLKWTRFFKSTQIIIITISAFKNIFIFLSRSHYLGVYKWHWGQELHQSFTHQINVCIPSLDITGLENIAWKTFTHGSADVSEKLASERIWQETLFKVQLLWIQFSPPPPPSHLPPTRRQQINCHKRLFSSQTVFSFTQELSAPVSVTRQCEC